MFFFFHFLDAETRYSTTKRKALAVVRCLAKVKWLVVRNKHSKFIYTEHKALKSIFMQGSKGNARIACWHDRLGKYDFIVRHQPAKDHVVGVANSLS